MTRGTRYAITNATLGYLAGVAFGVLLHAWWMNYDLPGATR